jgi:hypothetical protein
MTASLNNLSCGRNGLDMQECVDNAGDGCSVGRLVKSEQTETTKSLTWTSAETPSLLSQPKCCGPVCGRFPVFHNDRRIGKAHRPKCVILGLVDGRRNAPLQKACKSLSTNLGMDAGSIPAAYTTLPRHLNNFESGNAPPVMPVGTLTEAWQAIGLPMDIAAFFTLPRHRNGRQTSRFAVAGLDLSAALNEGKE